MQAAKSKKAMEEEEEVEIMALTLADAWKSFQSGTTSHGLPHIINAKGVF